MKLIQSVGNTMFQNMNTSQAVLTRLCVTVRGLQNSLNTLREEVIHHQAPVAPQQQGKGQLSTVDDAAIKTRIEAIAHDLDALKRDVATLKVSQVASPNPSSSTLPPTPASQDSASYSNAQIEALVRKECETHAKRQRDLMEALLTARYDRQIARSIQDALDTMRQDVKIMFQAQPQAHSPSPTEPVSEQNNDDFLDRASTLHNQDIRDIQIKEGLDGSPVVEISVKRSGGGRGSRGGGNSKRGAKS
jgi:hypothetical protein